MPMINGISSPLGGLSWDNRVSDASLVTELFARLEDRRVLYNPSEAESPAHCAQSVLAIRQILTEILAKAGADGVFPSQLREMGAACRKFLDRADFSDPEALQDMVSFGHWRSWQFQDALGQLRGVFGLHIAVMAQRFDVNVPDDLQSILPEAPYEDELNA